MTNAPQTDLCLAPLRGVTGCAFRTVFCRHFAGLSRAVAPFIPTVRGGRVKPALLRELLPERNAALPVIPQVIGKDAADLTIMLEALRGLGYRRADLNAGCPWPMVARNGRGAGLLVDADNLRRMLDAGCAAMPNGFSIKVRLGLKTSDLLAQRMELFNDYPLCEVAIHPRTAQQMYEGHVDLAAFAACRKLCRHPVVFNGDIQVNVIGNTKPAGICGSGLIDATAELLRLGVLDSTGRILGPDEAPAGTPDAILCRLIESNGQYNVLLVDKAHTATGESICLFQKDIRELQLANGAIRAGINILLRHAGLEAEQLGAVLLAGAFGNFIRRKNARRIGMLPPIPCDRIRFMGNTASLGAKMMLLSKAEEEYAARVTLAAKHVDLSLDPEFQMEFGEAMLFPEQDIETASSEPSCPDR